MLLDLDTKEKPFSCPYCRRSFQRSDVKAAHVKKCHTASSDQPNDDTETEGGAVRRRVRIACNGCRKRKMRCDGEEPCAPCQATSSFCHYRGSTDSTTARNHSASQEESQADQVDQPRTGIESSTGDNMHQRPLSFALQTPIMDSGMPFDAVINTYQDINQNASAMTLDTPFQGSTRMSVPDTSANDEPEMLMPHENVFYPLPDAVGMDNFWQTPTLVWIYSYLCVNSIVNLSQNSQFWFDGSGFAWQGGELFDSSSPSLDHTISSSMQRLTATMQEYFNRKSRAPSPSLSKASKMWYSAPPNLDNHNKDIVRVFLNIFQNHISETFPLFKDSVASGKNRAAYTLAMAATGGLFCTVLGSAQVAKSMYNDARRLLLVSVCWTAGELPFRLTSVSSMFGTLSTSCL